MFREVQWGTCPWAGVWIRIVYRDVRLFSINSMVFRVDCLFVARNVQIKVLTLLSIILVFLART